MVLWNLELEISAVNAADALSEEAVFPVLMANGLQAVSRAIDQRLFGHDDLDIENLRDTSRGDSLDLEGLASLDVCLSRVDLDRRVATMRMGVSWCFRSQAESQSIRQLKFVHSRMWNCGPWRESIEVGRYADKISVALSLHLMSKACEGGVSRQTANARSIRQCQISQGLERQWADCAGTCEFPLRNVEAAGPEVLVAVHEVDHVQVLLQSSLIYLVAKLVDQSKCLGSLLKDVCPMIA